ncbi:hypothetical protein KP509_12G032100 [Ceratopteris richardii]|uniref:Pentatricopeptide repeat-containing protein n=1 Tax=Ceratopteris richardii TaxID=49495 RepID=A0A8T2TQV6_CERRI|nr:hypothetical protein KP509_12G032100 [Ceratopteris richardii]
MYAKCGTLTYAHEVFDKLMVRNDVSWTTLINGYIEVGFFEDAMNCFRCFKEMEAEGISPNWVTYVSLSKAYIATEDINKATEVLAEIQVEDLSEVDAITGSSVIDAYAKCGLMEKATKVFDKLPSRNIVTWNTLITACVENGCNKEALCYFDQMQCEGVFPDAVTFICCLKACGNLVLPNRVNELYSQIKRLGLLDRDQVVGTALIDMYAKFGLPIMAQEVFDKLVHRDVVIWTALIACLTEAEYAEKAIKCFERMQLEGISPDFKAFTSVLRACGKSRDIIKGHEVHVKVCEVGGSEGNVFIGSTLVDMYAKCGTLTYAHEVFDKLMVRNDVSWTTLIKGYIEVGFFEDAMNCFEQMEAEGISPNWATYVSLSKAYIATEDINKATEVLAEIQVEDLSEVDAITGSSVIDAYAKCGLMEKATKVFDKLPSQNIVTWNTLITTCVENGCNKEALCYFDQMQCEGVFPDAVTFICCLKACGNLVLPNSE